jgi:plasmid maintenance system killer protein
MYNLENMSDICKGYIKAIKVNGHFVLIFDYDEEVTDVFINFYI